MATNSIPQKRCSRCHKYLPLESFAKSKNGKLGLHSYCRKCAAEHKGRVWHPECLVPDGYRQCARCKTIMPMDLKSFRSVPREKGGLSYTCRECLRKENAEYLETHREENKQRSKQRYYAMPEARQEYREKNADKIAEGKRDWRKRNPDKAKKHKRDSQKRNRPAANVRTKRWALKNPDKLKAHYHNRRAREMGAEGFHTDEDLQRIFEEQEGRCFYCGATLYKDIKYDVHLEHIIPLSRGGSNWPENLAYTCEHCNLSKNNLLPAEWQAVRGW